MTVLLDSWTWIEYFKGSEKGRHAEKYMKGGEQIIISTINVAEVFRYTLSTLSLREAEAAVNYMLNAAFVIPVNVEIAIEAAKIKHEKKWGLGDSIILATARQNTAVVVTGDEDFRNEKNVVFLG